jgi:hypothetical protein
MTFVWKIVGIPLAFFSAMAGGSISLLIFGLWAAWRAPKERPEPLSFILMFAVATVLLNLGHFGLLHLFKGHGKWLELSKQTWRLLLWLGHGVGFLGLAALFIFAGPK